MPNLIVSHKTVYTYRKTVCLGPHRMMLRPRETPELKLLSHRLTLSPEGVVTWSHDVAGNAVATATFADETRSLTIESRAEVALSAPIWPVFAIASAAQVFPFCYSDEDQIDLGALARPQYADGAGRLSAWSRGFVMQDRTDTLSLLKDLSHGVASQIGYQSRDVEGTQGPQETLDRREGSCRDLAVLFAEAVRTIGFGARIVSGYIFDPASDRVGSAGAGSTHAWAEVFVPGAGWIAFDPTNRAVGSGHLIAVAAARHITQIAPVTGSYRGIPGSDPIMEVEVRVAET